MSSDFPSGLPSASPGGPPITLDDLLPHRPPMRLISEIIAIDEQRATTAALVTEDWPLVQDGYVDSLVAAELVAQSAGVANGYLRVVKKGIDSEKKGWLVGIKKAVFTTGRIRVGARIIVCAETRFVYDTFREIYGKAHVAGVMIAEVTLQVFQSDETAPL